MSKNAKSINEAFYDMNSGVEFFPMSSTDAAIVDVQSDVHTYVVPEKVPGHTAYSVKLIGDYAFEGCVSDIEEVVVPNTVQLNYIGARAFVKDNTAAPKPIKNIFVVNATPADLATSAFGLHDAGVTGNYDEVTTGQKIYVKKGQDGAIVDAYKTAWPTMADKIDYKIPGISIANTYGTFAREFDVDLTDYSKDAANGGKGKVWAFIAGDGKLKPGAGQGGTDGTEYHIIMHSINEGATDGTDGTYIPAGTGVLLKAADGTPATPSDYHYTIGEKDIETPVTGSDVLMVGVTVADKYLTDTNRNLYAMQGGVFKPFAGQTVKIPVHKAYLQLPVQAAGAKVMFFFDDISSVDSSQLAVESSANGEIYDLQGRRVTAPSKGLYIKNGKKVIIK